MIRIQETGMYDFGEHKADGGAVMGGWIMAILVNFGLVLLTL